MPHGELRNCKHMSCRNTLHSRPMINSSTLHEPVTRYACGLRARRAARFGWHGRGLRPATRPREGWRCGEREEGTRRVSKQGTGRQTKPPRRVCNARGFARQPNLARCRDHDQNVGRSWLPPCANDDPRHRHIQGSQCAPMRYVPTWRMCAQGELLLVNELAKGSVARATCRKLPPHVVVYPQR